MIKCDELATGPGEVMVKKLAKQVGYFPVFSFLVSASGMIDALVTATTGTKAGMLNIFFYFFFHLTICI